jgi:post-segregation antitoxin (ccd killing protein)
MEKSKKRVKERVYDTTIVFKASQTLAQALKEKAKSYGLNVSDFLRLKLVEILQEQNQAK